MATKLTNVYYTVICFVRLPVCDHIHVSRWISNGNGEPEKKAGVQIFFRKLLQTFECTDYETFSKLNFRTLSTFCIYFKRFVQANLDGFCLRSKLVDL